MPNWPFRFLHAADFHLEMPPFGIEEIPEHLSEHFLDATYRSAEKIFDTAIAEKVDFVILSGDLLDSQQTGPRGPLFLVSQFERLAEHNIIVYWAAGRVDLPETWPPSIAIPDNVYRFVQGKPQSRVHRRADTPLARLIGASRSPDGRIHPDQFDPKEAGLFSIAVSHGRVALDALRASRVDYWALGGRHARRTPCEAMPVVHVPGTPQGRQPEETGAHGCTLVEVDVERNTKLTFIETNAMRWESQSVTLDDQANREQLEQEMARRIESLREKTGKAILLISWQIAGSGDLVDQLRRGILKNELLSALRKQFGKETAVAWSVDLAVDPPSRYPASWYEEDSICGEFLRQLKHHEEDAEESIELESSLSSLSAESSVGELVLNVSEASRTALLREAAMLGIDLLAGEDHES